MNPESPDEKVKLLLEQAWMARREDDYPDARQILREASRICQEHNLVEPFMKTLKLLAQLDHDTDNLRDALSRYHQLAELHHEKQNHELEAHTLRHIADVHRELGSIEEANHFYTQALDIYKKQNNQSSIDVANLYKGMGLLFQQMSEKEKAKEYYDKALDIFREFNVQTEVDECIKRIATL